MRRLSWVLFLSAALLTLGACPEEVPAGTDANSPVDAGQDAAHFDVPAGDVEIIDSGHDASIDDAASDAANPTDAGQDDASADDAAEPDTGPSCEDECTAGEQICDGRSAYRICGQYDLDSCLELSPSVACGQSLICSDGACMPNCQDQCPASGTMCQDANTLLSCGNFDTDACLDLGAASACGTGRHCEAGACVDDGASCADECQSGQSTCFGDSVRTCGQFDSDSCLDWGEPVMCASGNTCVDGSCTPFCQNECDSAGSSECVGNAVHSCGNYDDDNCLEWGPMTACQIPEYCSAGSCSVSCQNDCDNIGAMVCSADGQGVSICGEYDGDPCLDLSTPTPCPGGYACSGGLCIASCSNDCTLGTAPRCASDGLSLETCGDFDDDICSEWGSAVPCPGGAACSGGSCETPCTEECSPNGLTSCVDGQNATHSCGQYDLDSCLEWTSPSACESWQTCADGVCELAATPAAIVINEVLYDSAGGDSNPGNKLMVELWGPAGQSLDGYHLIGVNASDGDDYQDISLDGEVMGNDGYYLIAHPDGDSALVALAEMTTERVNYQNGPDSIQLRWHDRVVDALAYGTFGSTDVFAGEGSPAVGSGAGKSLSRNAAHDDSDDNSADFFVPAALSPRDNPAACSDECDNAGDTQCSGQQIQTCISDGDADPCLEWSTATNCPTAGDICDSATQACETPSCSDECTPPGDSTRCGGSNDEQISACVTDADSDPCYEWSPFAGCAVAGQVCMAGQCSEPCTPDCQSAGATQCAVNGEVQTCGNYDSDLCLEWSAAAACPNGQTCIGTSCQAANAPEVRLIDPQGTVQSTQGKSHRMLVDATAAPGRSIVRVEYYADNSKLGETSAAPHEYYFTVPAATATGATIALQARAVDDQGVIGLSSFAYLNVLNDVPVADFTATVTNTSTVTVDASACSDTETLSADLEVCWDWDNDGSCDTAFSTEKITSHDFGASGTYTVRMVVRDAVGQTAENTREVTFTDIQYLGGQTITTTLWYGTVIVTGDLIVGSGEVLTIAEGTQILFVHADTNNDGVGDYTFDVRGSLVINGTVANPVVFSGQDSNSKVPGGWDRIILQGSVASTISHAIIEYADVGVEIRNASTLDDVSVRNTSDDCIQLNNADNASLSNISVTHCAADGLAAFAGSTGVTVTGLSSDHNGDNGLSVLDSSTLELVDAVLEDNDANGALTGEGSSLDISASQSQDNAGAGLFYQADAAGTAMHNQLRRNGGAGVSLLADGNGNPDPILQYNNIYSNAVSGSLQHSLVTPSGISTTYTCCSSSGSTSATYTAPANTTIRRAKVSFNDGSYSYNDAGYLLTGSGSTLKTWSSDFSGWVYVPSGTTSLKVKTSDSGGSSDTETITLSQVELISSSGAADISAISESGTVDMRFNYLGIFPNILSRVSMSRNTGLNIQGFVGQAFDSSWNRGPYVGGDAFSGNWSGSVYVTGNVDVATGQTLDVASGSEILFVDTDQNADGEGDWNIRVYGAFNLNGSLGNEVEIKGYSPSGDDFQNVTLSGVTATDHSNWNDVNIQNGKVAIIITDASSLNRVNVTAGSQDGLVLSGGTGASLSHVNVDGAGAAGIHFTGAQASTLSYVQVQNSTDEGILVENSSPTIEDSVLRDNGRAGLRARSGAAATINYSLVTYNAGAGLQAEGDAELNATNNVVKFNDDSGLSVWSNSDGHPLCSFESSNIYGNAVQGSSVVSTASPSGISTSYTCCSSSGSTSASYTAPANTTIRRAKVSFNDGSYSYNDAGYLLTGSGSTLKTWSSDFSGWVYVPSGTTSLKVKTSDSGGSSDTETITLNEVELISLDDTLHYEMVNVTESGSTSAKFNYWTPNVGDVPNKIFESRSGAVDFSGYTGAEYDGSTVGPRP